VAFEKAVLAMGNDINDGIADRQHVEFRHDPPSHFSTRPSYDILVNLEERRAD
jgi:hypothetical protein